ncbi:hypothetical protein VP1G_09552 [Cytospora mali]|uniref:Uncharacterized protein n=1 Tax=Cytospora mali TaxID=578113 RepID=A0A194VEK5_CYTMA|nr:hypothetical protein VP1G_09552 [Valsa mali var. pyri (nom. inval.)]
MAEGTTEYKHTSQHLQQSFGSRGDGASPFVASSGFLGQTTSEIATADQSQPYSKPTASFSAENITQHSPEIGDRLAERNHFLSLSEGLESKHPIQMQSRTHKKQQLQPGDTRKIPKESLTPAQLADWKEQLSILANIPIESKRRLMQARAESEGTAMLEESDEPPASTHQGHPDGAPMNTEADQENERSQEMPFTHYTISEDEIATLD